MSSFCEDVSFEEVLVPIGVGGESHRSSSAISEFPTSKASSFIDACRGGALIIGEGPGFEAASTWASVKLKGYPGVTCQYFYFSGWFSRIPRCEISQVPRRWLKSFLRRSLKQWSLWRVKVEKSAAEWRCCFVGVGFAFPRDIDDIDFFESKRLSYHSFEVPGDALADLMNFFQTLASGNVETAVVLIFKSKAGVKVGVYVFKLTLQLDFIPFI